MTSSILTLADIERQLRVGRPRRRYVIPNVLPVGPCILFGPSGSGKTGAVIRMATSIAGGLAWAGRRVERGSVMYIAGEARH